MEKDNDTNKTSDSKSNNKDNTSPRPPSSSVSGGGGANRFVVYLPNDQKNVVIFNPSSVLADVLQKICINRNIDHNKFVAKDMNGNRLDKNLTLKELGLNEITLITGIEEFDNPILETIRLLELKLDTYSKRFVELQEKISLLPEDSEASQVLQNTVTTTTKELAASGDKSSNSNISPKDSKEVAVTFLVGAVKEGADAPKMTSSPSGGSINKSGEINTASTVIGAAAAANVDSPRMGRTNTSNTIEVPPPPPPLPPPDWVSPNAPKPANSLMSKEEAKQTLSELKETVESLTAIIIHLKQKMKEDGYLASNANKKPTTTSTSNAAALPPPIAGPAANLPPASALPPPPIASGNLPPHPPPSTTTTTEGSKGGSNSKTQTREHKKS